jgi:methionyl-tRNA formyltransferase
MAAPLKLVFMGSDPIALPLLDWLAAEGGLLATIVAVYTQPDRPAGRGQKIEAGAIKRWAVDHRIPVRQPEKLIPDERAWLAAQQPDVALVMAYGQILKDDFINAPRLGTLNLHASILPRYRGASPIQTAIARGDSETGVSLMRIVRKLDAGPVAAVETVPIEPFDTALDVEKKLAAACVPLLARSLPWLRAGTLEFSAQDDAAATYCRKLVKEDGRLDFGAPAAVLAARINGLFPWPGCTTEISGVSVRFGLANPLSDAGGAPGTVAGEDAAGLLIATREGMLRVRRLQRPGGTMLPAPEFLRGFPVPAGTILPSQPMTSLLVQPGCLAPRSAAEPRSVRCKNLPNRRQ